jgi:hypothetical protein
MGPDAGEVAADGGDKGRDGAAKETGAEAPPCTPPLGVCDAVRQCGCAVDERCDIGYGDVLGTFEQCNPDTGGTATTGHEGCTPGSCAPGNICLGGLDETGAQTTFCFRWCVDDQHCDDIPGSECSEQLRGGEDMDGNPIYIEPYKVCSPERPGADAEGVATFSVCLGERDDCPGGPGQDYTIDGEKNGTCTIEVGSPLVLSFNIYNEQQDTSLTGYQLAIPSGSGELALVECGDRSRFSFFLPGYQRPFSTTTCASPPRDDSCELRARYDEASEGFELQFRCNRINMSHSDETLTTVDEGGALGAGSLTMKACAIKE